MPQDDKAAVVFSIGQKIEHTQETFEKEHVDLQAMKNAFAMAVKCLEDYRGAMVRDQQEAKLSIKEAEYGRVYVTRCIELVSNLCLNAEAKRLRAEGAIEALKQTVLQVKEIYDSEISEEKLVSKSKKRKPS